MAQDNLDSNSFPQTDSVDTGAGTVSVTTSSTTIVAAKKDRRFLYLVNDSDTDIYLALGTTAVVNRGILLKSAGGSFNITLANIYKGAIMAIHGGSGTKNMTLVES